MSSHRPRLRRGGVPALRMPFGRVLAPSAASRPPTASDRDGNAFLPTVRNRRSTSHAKRACGSCCSLGLLRPVSATGGGLRAHPQFAMVVLLRLTACSTPLLIGLTSACFAHCARPSCAPQKMPEMTYTPSFLMKASFFRYLCQCSVSIETTRSMPARSRAISQRPGSAARKICATSRACPAPTSKKAARRKRTGNSRAMRR